MSDLVPELVQRARNILNKRQKTKDEKYREDLRRFREILTKPSKNPDVDAAEMADIITRCGLSVEVVEADVATLKEHTELVARAATKGDADAAAVKACEAWRKHDDARTEKIREMTAEAEKLAGEMHSTQYHARACLEAGNRAVEIESRHPRIFGSSPKPNPGPSGISTSFSNPSAPVYEPDPLRDPKGVMVQRLGTGEGTSLNGKGPTVTYQTPPAAVSHA